MREEGVEMGGEPVGLDEDWLSKQTVLSRQG